jgi:hypothetical protein
MLETRKPNDEMLLPDSIADTYWHLHTQVSDQATPIGASALYWIAVPIQYLQVPDSYMY